MIIAIHQPNYLPWQGYFYKIINCDRFVFLDNVQFTQNSIINRNKIKTSSGEIWLTVPVLTKHSFGQRINDVKINNTVNWRRKHWNAIHQNYNKTPFFDKCAPFLKAIYDNNWEKLVDLNRTLIKFVVISLGIKKEFFSASELGVSGKSTDLLISICKKLDADVYLSGESGKKYMDEQKFKDAGIRVKYTNFRQPRYTQLYGDFIPNLSIIDLIFNCGESSLQILTEIKKENKE